MKKAFLSSITALLVAMLAACGGDNPAGPSAAGGGSGSGNQAPTASINAAPSVALMSVTSVAFSATANDPNGDALSYEWDFGDGSKATGPTAQKLYEKAGGFNVTLKVTDAKGASTSTSTNVTVKSLNGFWNDRAQGYGIEVTQSGKSISGRTVLGVRNLTGALKGTVDQNLVVNYKTSYFNGAFRDYFDGRLDSSLDAMSGKLDLSDGQTTFTFNLNMVRQP